MIDLRSDTLTRPCEAMRAEMARAEVGDDVYGEDPTVNALQAEVAELLGKEAALFAPSGTQTNLLALLTHCGRGDEYIVGQSAHTYRFEGGGAAALGGIQPQPLEFNERAELPLDAIAAAIKPDDVHFARTRLVCLENTHNGQPLTAAYVASVEALCRDAGLALHLDGARLFNAAVDSQQMPIELAAPFASVSVCLSKGLGAPVGSLLAGSAEFIEAARRWRKMLGGGMRQAGVIAAAGRYALTHNVQRLAEDHAHAEAIAEALRERFGADAIVQHTNMVHLALPSADYAALRQHLADSQIRVGRPRWVLHLNVDAHDTDQIIAAIHAFRG